MATLNEAFVFTSTASVVSFSHLDDLSCLLITHTDFSSSIYKTEDRKLQKNWVFKQGYKCTSPVAYDEKNGSFVVVQNSKILRQWNLEEDDVNTSKKIKFSASIYSILSRKNAEPLVLFTNGATRCLTEAIASHKNLNLEGYLSDDDLIQWTDCHSHFDDKSVTFFVSKSLKNDDITLHVVTNNSSDGSASHHSRCLTENKLNPVTFCTTCYGSELYFLCLGSSGELCRYNAEDLSCQEIKGNVKLDGASALSMASIDQTHVAIAGVPDSKGDQCCIIWNTKYCSEAARESLPSRLKDNKMCVADGTIYVTCQNGVVGLEYHLETAKLANVVGKMVLDAEPSEFPVVSWDGKFTKSAEKQKYGKKRDTTSVKSSLVSVTETISKLIEEQNLKKLEKYFDGCPIVAEADLVSILKFIISKSVDSTEEESTSNPFTEKTSSFINKVLNASFSNMFLANHLRSLSLNDSMLLLRYLHYLLFTDDDTDPSVPAPTKLTDWVCLILDSHFNQLILTNDPQVISFLSNLNLKVQNEYKFCRDLLKLDQQMTNVREKYELPKVHSNSLYSIHILQL